MNVHESGGRWFNINPSASKDLQAELRLPKVIERPDVFRDRNHRINKIGLVCVVICEISQILTGNSSNPNAVGWVE